MNETEKQNYIRLQTMKLQKLSDVIQHATRLSYYSATNIRIISDYNDVNALERSSNYLLLEAINDYKTLLSDFGELE